jgi:hypothetical protein
VGIERPDAAAALLNPWHDLHVSVVPQECSEPVCSRPAAFRTRTKPAWCGQHITEILRRGGLEPLEPFTKLTGWRLTRCLRCGCQAHYRLEYTLEKNRLDEATCRACYWREWARSSRSLQGAYACRAPVAESEARKRAEDNGYEYLGPLTDPSLADDPHRVRCVHCGRISAERLGDIDFGCTCQSNPRRDRQTTNVSGPKKKDLLKDSGLPVLDCWDHDRNDTSVWETVTVRAHREAHWKCPDCGLCFTRKISDMIGPRACPDCEPKRRAAWETEYARYKVTPVAHVPELLTAWADEADPATVTVADGQLRRFRCPQGHHPKLSPLTFLQSGCHLCRGNETRRTRLEDIQIDPSAHGMNREIAAQWHPTRNGKIRLETVAPGSRRNLWWRDPECGHEWQETPANREKGRRLRCPECRTILDSLAYHYPEIAAEWSASNPSTAWQVRPSGQTAFSPSWVCANNVDHTWQAQLTSRAAGAGCPECRETGKSKIELKHHAAAQVAFGHAVSGQAVTSDAFRRRARWLVDITADLPNGQKIVIEYDGSYWHADKAEIDTAKSLDLLAAGYVVARLREHPLPPLPVSHDGYAEFVVYANMSDPEATIARVKEWTESMATRRWGPARKS